MNNYKRQNKTGKDLEKLVSNKIDYISDQDALFIVANIVDYIKSGLINDNRIEIRGFGSFSLRKRKKVNSKEEYNSIYFRQSKALHNKLNNIKT